MKRWTAVALPAVVSLCVYAYAFRASKPEPAPGKIAVCGYLVPTRYKDWRVDCGMFGPSIARDGPMGPPPPAGYASSTQA